MNIVVPMAGGDALFRQHGFPFPKPVVEIAGRPLVEHAFDCLSPIHDARFIFVIRKDDDLRFHLRDMLQLMAPGSVVLRAEGETAGAACTVLLAVEYIDNDEELVIANADQVINVDLEAAIGDFRARGLDAASLVFDSVHPRWSFVKTDADGLVVEAAEKRPISRNATAGFYYFAKGKFFVEAAQNLIRKDASENGGYFVCPAFNEMILHQQRVGVIGIERDRYISLATPQAVEEYEQALIARRRAAQ